MSDEKDAGTPTTAPVRTLDQGALKALAHPLRVQIYDILSQQGAQTASSLAELTGESSGSTSYHLRALAKHDLIREVEGRGSARERWWERPRGGVSFTNPDALKTPSGRAASQVVMTEFLGRRHQQLMRYITQSMNAPALPSEDEALISTSTVPLTPAQSAELIRRLQAVVDEFSDAYRGQESPDARLFNIRADVFPLPDEA
ncbi:helix-turn-helix domain-containing protein [Microbacterium sp. W1N]|uniref:winged helix-turn-helix domain-containing protein n=1 Tax=Microbacterium festucae TaxID=2977531 RepID=UPI0021C09EFA|nr:helix-turn-helix domain-containing protein [Microbacterium festucae]MCT9820125.1 helix-turn-helix domain-containing protein [Microbacterium festucae]